MGFYGYKKFGVLPIATAIVDGGTPVNQMPVPVNSVVPAIAPSFPRPPLEIQSFTPRTPMAPIKPPLFDLRTAQSFLPPSPVIDVSSRSLPIRPTGQDMAFPANPNVEPAKDPSYTGGSSVPPSGGGWSSGGGGGGGGGGYYEEQYLEEQLVSGDSAGMQGTSAANPLVIAAAGAAGGFALGGPLGAAIGGVLGFLVGKR